LRAWSTIATVLIGREGECRQIDELLSAARDGRSGALVLRGDPGIGKSALLRYAAECADGWRVLHADGVESEAELPFAALDQLVRPLRGNFDQIPQAQARTLETALALGAPAPTDRFAAAVATVSLLAAAADEGSPLLCLIDDAQWLDAESAEALVFACRRFRAEHIAVLFTIREGERRRILTTGLPEIRIGGLDAEGARILLAQAKVEMAPVVISRIIDVARGNPLALLELPSALTASQRTGRAQLPEPLPVGSSVEHAYVGRARSLPVDTRRALVIAAVSDTDDLSTLVAALDGLGLSARALEPAEEAGLLSLSGGRFVFRHPLVRSALHQSATAPELRAAHRVIAGSLHTHDQRSRRAWHAAAAALGPDDSVAEALDAAGRDARARGGYATAAATFQRAADLSVGSEGGAVRLLAAGESFWLAGQAEQATVLLAKALSLSSDAALRSDIEHLRGRILMWSGSILEAHQKLRDEAESVAALEPARAALMMSEAVLPCLMAGDVRLAIHTGERARALAESTGGLAMVMSAAALGQALVLHGDTVKARGLLEQARAALDNEDAFAMGTILAQIATCLSWIEEFETSHRILRRLAETARSHGAIAVLPFILAMLSLEDHRVGNFAAAYAGAAEAVTLALQTQEDGAAPLCYATLARSEAVLGRDQDCRDHGARALELAERVGAGSIRTYVASALGLLELGLGRPDRAVAALEELPALVAMQGLEEPAVIQWAPDLIESYVQLGNRDDAEAALATFTGQAERTGRTWALAAAARCRGLLALDADFEREFDQALIWHERAPTPFERARTELSYGTRLRRAGLRLKSRERLRSALDEFERMGAAPWAQRAQTELRASGARLRSRKGATEEELTAQELQVALTVAEGATNRETAARLFLSPKTIEFHLSHIFRKLGLRSRTELARRFASKRDGLLAVVLVLAWTAVRQFELVSRLI
jgi:DNA-binding CsgD family transcriptional regulator